MLITRKKTTTEDVQIEVKTPAYYSGKYSRIYMLCENGDIIIVNPSSMIMKWTKDENKIFYNDTVDEMLAGKEIGADEFRAAYEATVESLLTSMQSTETALA